MIPNEYSSKRVETFRSSTGTQHIVRGEGDLLQLGTEELVSHCGQEKPEDSDVEEMKLEELENYCENCVDLVVNH